MRRHRTIEIIWYNVDKSMSRYLLSAEKHKEASMMQGIAAVICGVLFAIFSAGAADPKIAWGAEWVLADENPASSFYYDKAGIAKPRKEVIRVTMRVVYTEEGKADALETLTPTKYYEKLSESRYLYELDCRERKSKLLRVTHLDEAGNQIKAFDLSEKTDWEDIPFASRIEAITDNECGQ